jgi:peptidoglycan hydrolase-like protein with peptidoglycan-binding domain
MRIAVHSTKGNSVTYLQVRLNARLYPSPKLNIGGQFGPATRRAVERFQAANRITADGVVRPIHLATLTTVSRGAPIPAPVRKFTGELATVDDFVGYVRDVERGKASAASPTIALV